MACVASDSSTASSAATRRAAGGPFTTTESTDFTMSNFILLPSFSPNAEALGEGIKTSRAVPRAPCWSIFSHGHLGDDEMEEESNVTGDKTLDPAGICVPAGMRAHELAHKTLRECREYLLGVKDDAEKQRLTQSLTDGLSHIAAFSGDAPAELFGDGAPLSFTWRAGGLFGGLLFHGSHDRYGSGGAPTFAVTLTPTYGWQIHT